MSTALSRTTSTVRRLAFITVIAVIVLWILQSQFHIFDSIIQVTPSVKPNTTPVTYNNCPNPVRTFEKIPTLKLSSYALASGTKAKFSTDKTKFPTMPATVTVYKLNKTFDKLGIVDRAVATAQELGFMGDYVRNGSIYSWQNDDETRLFSFDTTSYVWQLTTNFNNTSLSMLSGTTSNYAAVAQSLMRAVKLINSNYVGYDYETIYVLRKFDKSLESTSQLTKANILKLTYYKNLEAITCKDSTNKSIITRARVLSPDYKDQSFNAQITGTGSNLSSDLLTLNVREFEIADSSGIYPTLTFEEAYSMLQENKATLYWLIQEGANIFTPYKELKVNEFQIIVDNTKLVYMEPQKYLDDEESTHYLLPFYKFSGKATLDNNAKADFIFLVPALRTEEYK